MLKSTYTFFGCLLISLTCFAAPTTLDCQSSNNFESNLNELEKVAGEVEIDDACPPPTKDQFTDVCLDLFKRQESPNPGEGFIYTYQEKLWKLSCAEPRKETLDTARIKIQRMWNKHRAEFRCNDFPDSIATGSNITKFSLDTGFSGFIVEAVRKYKLDMNFIDPKDKKSVLDFVVEQEAIIRKTPPVNIDKADEYNRISKILEANGAKRGKDL